MQGLAPGSWSETCDRRSAEMCFCALSPEGLKKAMNTSHVILVNVSDIQLGFGI